MRKTILTIAALCALAVPGAAVAQAPDPPDTQPAAPTLLPAPAPPTTPVTDETGASTLAKAFLISRSSDLVPGGHAIQVDIAACRQVDAVQRFYCLATARVVRVQQVHVTRWFVRDHSRSHSRRARAAGDGGGDGDWSDHRDNRHQRRERVPRFRVQLFACVAVVRIQGGPVVAPSATIPVRDCVQVNRGPQPTPLV